MDAYGNVDHPPGNLTYQYQYPPPFGTFEDDVPFPQLGDVSSLEGNGT